MKSDFERRVARLLVLILGMTALVPIAVAAEVGGTGYLIQPGDVLAVSVWKEPDLQQELLVRPDGGISFPLAGDLPAAGRTPTEVQQDLVARIEEYIPDPVVTVQLLQIDGNMIYVLGKVNRAGAFVMSRPIDVTQALALAGGLAVFAEQDSISIIRRDGGGQTAMSFNYDKVQYGRELQQNILLRPGDVVVVP